MKGKQLNQQQLTALCGALADTSRGLTKSEIKKLLGQCQINAVDDGYKTNGLVYTTGLNTLPAISETFRSFLSSVGASFACMADIFTIIPPGLCPHVVAIMGVCTFGSANAAVPKANDSAKTIDITIRFPFMNSSDLSDKFCDLLTNSKRFYSKGSGVKSNTKKTKGLAGNIALSRGEGAAEPTKNCGTAHVFFMRLPCIPLSPTEAFPALLGFAFMVAARELRCDYYNRT
jgi:hypothetical protein